MAGYFLAQTLYFQAGLGLSVLKAGLVNIPFAIVTGVTAGVGAAVLMPRIGRRVLQIGAVVLVTGVGLLALVALHAQASTSFWQFVPGLMVTGAGFGFVVAPVAALTTAKVDVAHAGSVSGLFNTTGQLANAFGASMLGTVFFEVLNHQHARSVAALFRPGYLVVLGLVAVGMVAVTAAAQAIPADAHRHVAEGAGAH